MASGRIIQISTGDYPNKLCKVANGGDIKDITENIRIPMHLSFLNESCEVTYDSTDKVITSVISFPDDINQSPFNSPNTENSGISPFNAGSYIPGDYMLNVPEAGFIGLLRGFVSVIGSSPLAQIFTFGTKKMIKFVGENLQWEGGKFFNIKVKSVNGSTPEVNIKLGYITIITDTQSYIEFEFFNVVKVSLDNEYSKIYLYDASNKKYNTIYDFGYNPNEKEYQNQFSLTHKAMMTLKDVGIDMVNLTLKTSELTMNSSKKTDSCTGEVAEHYGKAERKVDGTYNIKAGNLKIQTGAPMGGLMEILNGTMTGIRLSQVGMMDLKAVLGVNILGTDDLMVSGRTLLIVMGQIVAALNLLATAAPMGPYGAGQAAAAGAIAAAIPASFPILINPFIRHGIPNPVL